MDQVFAALDATWRILLVGVVLGALVLTPVLLVADIWDGIPIRDAPP